MHSASDLPTLLATLAKKHTQKNFPTLFRRALYTWHKKNGRHFLPWRAQTATPYDIFVSEVMLQQTQVDRVIEKYLRFLATFPTIHALAKAPQSRVITLWSGLGYNRRGINLHKAAQKILHDHGGTVPQSTPDLLALPGIGPYAASAIRAFAFHLPDIVIETNIRAVYLHTFFSGKKDIPDSALAPLIAKTLDQSAPHRFYAALMDCGSQLKKLLPNPSRASRHHARQSTFQGSLRQIRGAALRLAQATPFTAQSLLAHYPDRADHIEQALAALTKEGFLTKKGNRYHLA